MKRSGQAWGLARNAAAIALLLAAISLAAQLCAATPANPPSIPNIFKPASTPADSIFNLSRLVLAITGAIFAVVFGRLLGGKIPQAQRR
jgi:hypothetical protein